MHAQDLIEDASPRLPAGMLVNLLRAQTALGLLAKLTSEAAYHTGITLDEAAAIAGYASEDLDSLLTGIEAGPDV